MVEYRFKCSACGKAIVTSRERGAAVKCPTCSSAVTVPADAAEIIPAHLVEVLDSGNRRTQPPPPPPRFRIKRNGCFLPGMNCGCGCLVIILAIVGLFYALFH